MFHSITSQKKNKNAAETMLKFRCVQSHRTYQFYIETKHDKFHIATNILMYTYLMIAHKHKSIERPNSRKRKMIERAMEIESIRIFAKKKKKICFPSSL